ncbi:baseplate J/gp47 family protein, partial [Enterobacter cloacae]
RVSDVSAISPAPAKVTISVLSREGDGTASEELLRIVERALNDEDVRPVADRIKVQSAKIIPYQIDATLFLFPGPESEPIRKEASQRLTQ